MAAKPCRRSAYEDLPVKDGRLLQKSPKRIDLEQEIEQMSAARTMFSILRACVLYRRPLFNFLQSILSPGIATEFVEPMGFINVVTFLTPCLFSD